MSEVCRGRVCNASRLNLQGVAVGLLGGSEPLQLERVVGVVSHLSETVDI